MKAAEDDVDKQIAKERTEKFDDILDELEEKKNSQKDMPTDLLKQNVMLFEAQANEQKRSVDKELEDRRKDLLDQRKRQINQKLLIGAENDTELKNEIQKMLIQFNSNAMGKEIIE